MGFQIQVGHPKIILKRFGSFDQISDVFIRLFRSNEESVYIYWNDIPIRIDYRGDLQKNFNDILAMVWLMQRDEQGATKVNFTTQLLSIRWVVKWEDDRVVIDSEFNSTQEIYASYASALSKELEIIVSKQKFLKEWHTLLHQLVISLREGKITIKDGTERRKLEMLQAVDKSIVGYGKLYERRPQ